MTRPIVVDFHSHILPNLDHGCRKMEDCRKQLALMSDSGTDIAVATPHFYPHVHDVALFADEVDRAIERIQKANFGKAPEIKIGAEILLYPGLNNMENLERLCIRGTNVLMIELPYADLTDNHIRTLEYMLRDGYRVILAHIDRYLDKFAAGIDEILSVGAVAQINTRSLFSRFCKKRILKYLEETDKICAVGSDLHGVDKSAYRKFGKAQGILSEYYPEIMRRSNSLLEGAQSLL